ncbi:MAG: phytanoyl-CoA dioxygenase family protein [Pseudomonadota bacterium]
MFSLLTSNRSFDDPWIGNPAWVERGLHGARMKAAERCAAFRRWQVSWRRNSHAERFGRDGYLVLSDFLPPAQFERLLAEVTRKVGEAERSDPPEQNMKPGFQPQCQRPWGYDRFDGGTLNRFIRSDPGLTPEVLKFARDGRIANLARLIVGLPGNPANVRIYQTINGDETVNHDIQKDFHRDTFFSSMKYWFFLQDVEEDDGPFVFVPQSHRLDRKRLLWENAKAREAVEAKLTFGSAKGGAFRILEGEIAELGLPAPQSLTVRANTLVIADTLGFHRRGDAKPGTRRLSLYSSLRPMPFLPIGL